MPLLKPKKNKKASKLIGQRKVKISKPVLLALVLMLVIAGLVLYKTYAGTIVKALNADGLSSWTGAYKVTETSSDKKNMTVWELPKDTSVWGTLQRGYGADPSGTPGTYKFCATAKFMSGVGTVSYVLYDDSSLIVSESTFALNTTYNKHCISKYIPFNGFSYWLLVKNDRGYPTKVRVSNMTLER